MENKIDILEEDKINILKHVDYEMRMFTEARKLISEYTIEAQSNKDKTAERDKFIYNMAIESYMLHFRNLLVFFNYEVPEILKDKRTYDNVYVKQLLGDQIPTPYSIEDLKLIYRTINKQISHLTYTRLKPDIKEEQLKCLNELYSPMINSIKSFWEVKRELDKNLNDNPKIIE